MPGKNKPVIKKAMTELNGAPFLKFAEQRERWALEDCYRCPGEWQGVNVEAAYMDAATMTVEPLLTGRL